MYVIYLRKYNEGIAKDVTNSHEPNPDLAGSVFSDSLTADYVFVKD